MKKYFISIILFLLMIGGCEHRKPVMGGDLTEQCAELYHNINSVSVPANIFKPEEIELDEGYNDSITKNFSIKFGKVLNEDHTIYLEQDLDTKYNSIVESEMPYTMLPAENVKFPDKVVARKGEIETEEFPIKIVINDKLKLNTPYVFILSVGNVTPSVKIFKNTSKIAYVILRKEESTEITKVTKISRAEFLQPVKSFPYSLPAGATMECLINVEKFRGEGDMGDAGISTLMGIEGRCLLRFGDAGVSPDKLQACGEVVPFTFSTNKWYHIAAVFTTSSVLKIYVNGVKISEFNRKKPSLSGEWYIAKSWNDNRGILAKLSEIRVWTVERSENEIRNNMYGVSPNTPGLEAYWKMDKASGSEFKDVTEHGYNLELKKQRGGALSDVKIVTEKDPVEIQ